LRRHEPIFNVPGIVLVLLGACCLVHVVRWLLPADEDAWLTAALAFIPMRLVSGVAVQLPGGEPATITVLASLTDPKAAGGLDQAPVTVEITTGSASNALVVPVTALLAQSGGTYEVELITAGGHHRLVPVTPGIFDDASGLVQVTGTSLGVGDHVVVPAP